MVSTIKKAHLDDTIVLELPTPRKGKRGYHYDETVPGFGVAVTDKGTKTFFFYRKIGGVPKRITLGHFPDMPVETARQKAREYDNAIEGGLIGQECLPAEERGEPQETVASALHPRRRAFYIGIGARAAMACLAVMIYMATGVLHFWKSDEALQSVISFAIDDHLNHREVTFRSEDPAQIKTALEQELPFEVDIPRIQPDFKVVGGRAYKVGANSVAYSLWNAKNDNAYSLLQFRRVDFGVDSASLPQLIRPQGMAVKHTPCEVLYWSKGEYGFVLVADHGELLHGVTPELDSVNSVQAEARW